MARNGDVSRLPQQSPRLYAYGILLGALAMGVLLLVTPSRANDLKGSIPALDGPMAGAARVESLNETLSLKISAIKGNTIYAHGRSRGTIAGSGSFNLTLQNASRAVAVFSGGNSHGGVAGTGTGHYRVSGAVSYFTGSVSSFRGSGGYSGAKSLGVSVTGTINRQTYTVTISMHGKWNS